MPRKSTENRFTSAGQALVGSDGSGQAMQHQQEPEKKEAARKKDKVITAKVYPDTWASFTAINRAQGMTNNSVINMLISEYVRSKKEILK